eukprot:TRINITY_DN80840_c0_g1_i1.p1 TRINITY_DN80840_c0_g1~~TRINITY_DN80840_c0_g1_i1.p1  ORF type:complete len:125 (-),score=37.57 TRINITY_DN80840_c0_g1_i1:15-389(-)
MDISASHSGWYWCSLPQGSKELEASVFVEVIGDDLTIEATTQTSTQASNDVSGITEIVDDLELSIKQIEQTTVAAAEEPSTEASVPSAAEVADLVAKHLQPIHRQLADINGRLNYIEEKLKIKA